MAHALDLLGTTVTVFGAHDRLDHALSEELGRRGCTTHHVSVTTGWLHSSTHAIIRPDTASGAKAMQQLANGAGPPCHIIALRSETEDAAESVRVDELCRTCGTKHHLSVVWHLPLQPEAPDSHAGVPQPPQVDAIAAEVVDEIVKNHTPPHGISLT
jgi:hypothetical protein